MVCDCKTHRLWSAGCRVAASRGQMSVDLSLLGSFGCEAQLRQLCPDLVKCDDQQLAAITGETIAANTSSSRSDAQRELCVVLGVLLVCDGLCLGIAAGAEFTTLIL
jgi:hypothetical protein